MKQSLRRYKPLVLPSNNDILYKYIENNRIQVMESVINSIEYAIYKNLPIIEVFSFENMDFVVTIPYESFETNIDQIYSYYLKNEKYELCKRVIKIKDKLKSNEQKKKKTKSKSSFTRS